MRRIRREKNKNAVQGIKNRMKGVCKKAHTFNRLYGGDALICIRASGGEFTCYQSRPNLFEELVSFPELDFQDPESFGDGPGLKAGQQTPSSFSSSGSYLSPLEISSSASEPRSSTEGSQSPEPRSSINANHPFRGARHPETRYRQSNASSPSSSRRNRYCGVVRPLTMRQKERVSRLLSEL